MVPISKYGCEQAIKKWKKDEFEAINAVDMYKENLDGEILVTYPLIKEQQIVWQN